MRFLDFDTVADANPSPTSSYENKHTPYSTLERRFRETSDLDVGTGKNSPGKSSVREVHIAPRGGVPQ